jgi:hypothetical protein
MPGDEHTREHQDSRPFFVIPYWAPTATDPGDTGSARPVPGTVPWYMCGGIRTSTYQPGQVLEVAVDVRNFGGSNAPSLAQVTVWWADPTLGFLIKPENLIGFRTVPVPPRGATATTAIMAKEIPGSAPDHICLLRAGLTPARQRSPASRSGQRPALGTTQSVGDQGDARGTCQPVLPRHELPR